MFDIQSLAPRLIQETNDFNDIEEKVVACLLSGLCDDSLLNDASFIKPF